jgi:hypothetical protein
MGPLNRVSEVSLCPVAPILGSLLCLHTGGISTFIYDSYEERVGRVNRDIYQNAHRSALLICLVFRKRHLETF